MIPQQYTFARLPKPLRKEIDMFEVSDFDYLLSKGEYGKLGMVYNILHKMNMEGTPLSEEQWEVLRLPKKLWGDKADVIMREMWCRHLDEDLARRNKHARKYRAKKLGQS